jgi:hypothetical protein
MVQFPRSSAAAALEGEQRSLEKAKHCPNATLEAMLVGTAGVAFPTHTKRDGSFRVQSG